MIEEHTKLCTLLGYGPVERGGSDLLHVMALIVTDLRGRIPHSRIHFDCATITTRSNVHIQKWVRTEKIVHQLDP